MEIMIVFWFLFGLITYRMSVNKGYNKWIGLIMGILFGIFAVYVYSLLVDKNKKELFRKIEILEKQTEENTTKLREELLRINTRLDNLK